MRVPGAGRRDAGSSSHVLAGDGELLGTWLEEGYLQTALSRPGLQHRLQCSFWRGAAASTIFLAGWLTIKCWKADNYESNAMGDSVIFGWSKPIFLPKRIGGPHILSRF